MATYIQDTLDMIDMTVANYAQSVFTDFGGPVSATIRLGGVVAIAFLGINVMMQWVPLRVTDFAKWGVRYLIILAVATSWAQFLPFYDMLTNVPSSVGASLLDVSGASSLNQSLDLMVTSIFDFSDRAADESGFFSISLLSIILAIVGSLMACVAILVAGIAKIGLAMAVSLAPLFIASLLFRGTSDLFSSWAKFTLGFALIPLVLAGVMGAIVRIGGDLIASIDGAATLTDAAPFLIVALAAIFLMSQVPTMVNGLAGTVVATASGVREARQLAGGVGAGSGVKAVARTAHPAVAAVSGAVGAARAAEGGMGARASAGAQELVQNYEARKKGRERHQARMANMGRRSTFGGDFEAAQAGSLQFSRERRRQRTEARTADRSTSDKAKAPPG
ncbi:type IV secretion system protein VirB6 [Amaricoccus macauensis]|uniref:Type IV secretion system protein VirB6 n=1 Tax=Amaricoccus macauensis TaxID=57001 RepID=A0A840SZW5_9RHOB|nr:type IV secretion system protein VirB6 [Amaricoccus macauensis]